jgi:c(7)-type cytochrome triheme protein
MPALMVAGCLAALLLGGCGVKTRKKVLSVFIDGADKGPPPPTHRVRRDLLREIEDLERQLAEARAAASAQQPGTPEEEETLPVEAARTWQEAAALLPKDGAGQVDWVRAQETGDIDVRSGLHADAPEQAVFEMDVELRSSASELYRVTFSHGLHTQWLTCVSCHPAVFSMKRGEEPATITMSTIEAGEHCGVCHGGVSFGVAACGRCHTAIPATEWRPSEEPRTPAERASSWEEAATLLPVTEAGGPDWDRALAEGLIAPRAGVDPTAEDEEVLEHDVELVPDEDPDYRAVFSHESHTVWLSCDNCHPDPFEPEAGANAITMENMAEGEYCGVCHGKVTFGVEEMEACGRCHPAMAEG